MTNPATTTSVPEGTTRLEKDTATTEGNYVESPSQTELIAEFKIKKQWNDQLNNPKSEEFKSLSDTIRLGLIDMLSQDKSLNNETEFIVTILGFRYVWTFWGEIPRK